MPTLTLNVNGVDRSVTVNDTNIPLLWVLRDHLGLTGTKYGCGIEICGACTVHINGQPEKSCDVSLQEAAGKRVTTIEGLSPDRSHPAQVAWIQHQVPQCGWCQSGMLMTVAGKMAAGQHGAAIANGIQNVCVCGTYQRIKTACSGL